MTRTTMNLLPLWRISWVQWMSERSLKKFWKMLRHNLLTIPRVNIWIQFTYVCVLCTGAVSRSSWLRPPPPLNGTRRTRRLWPWRSPGKRRSGRWHCVQHDELWTHPWIDFSFYSIPYTFSWKLQIFKLAGSFQGFSFLYLHLSCSVDTSLAPFTPGINIGPQVASVKYVCSHLELKCVSCDHLWSDHLPSLLCTDLYLISEHKHLNLELSTCDRITKTTCYYLMLLPHVITSCYYHMLLSHVITTCYYHMLLPHVITSCYYLMLLPHVITTCYYHMLLSHVITTCYYHKLLPHVITTCYYLMLLSHVITTCYYHMLLPHVIISCYYHMLLPQVITTCYYHMLLPQVITTCYYHMLLPHVIISCYYHMLLPHVITTSYYHML